MFFRLDKRLHLYVPHFRALLFIMYQRTSGKVIRCPARHNYDYLTAFLQTGKHGICKPFPVFFLYVFVVGFLRVFYQVVHYHQRTSETCSCTGRGRCQVIVVSALQAPQIHSSVAAFDFRVRKHIRIDSFVFICFCLCDRVSDVF